MLDRCGMIYMEPVQLGWKPLVTSWVEQKLPECLSEEQKETIRVIKVYKGRGCGRIVKDKAVVTLSFTS